MGAADANPITVRHLNLTFPAEIDPVITPGQPEESYFQIGLSLMLPYLEPYLIRSLRAGKKHVPDPQLATAIDLFSAQEGQHYRQHARFNQAVRLHGGERLRELEAELEADYRRFSQQRSLRFNLAYTEGFEAMTLTWALFGFESRRVDEISPEVRDLFMWHAVEEIEHRMVAFDVYQQVCGSYFYRVLVGVFVVWHVHRFILRVSRTLIEADGGFRAKYGGALRTWRRLRPMLWLAIRGLVPKGLATFLPRYNPRRIAIPERVRTLATYYSERAAGEECQRA